MPKEGGARRMALVLFFWFSNGLVVLEENEKTKIQKK
jgi:hypothetical protein